MSNKTQTEQDADKEAAARAKTSKSATEATGGSKAVEEDGRPKAVETLAEAVYGNQPEKSTEELATEHDEAYAAAAQAELDAQAADREAGYATDATEGPAKVKPVESEDDASADA